MYFDSSSQRCQRCSKPVSVNIIDILGQNADGSYDWKDYHFCLECAQKFFQESATGIKPSTSGDQGNELAEQNINECPSCGITYEDFRKTGRLGCPQDYQVFREKLLPLLESIHSEKEHIGKSPRCHPSSSRRVEELSILRKKLQQAVQREAYEEAARLRDQIRTIERLEA
jgi:protein arginine kinase activator